MIPTLGRIVHYTLSNDDAVSINRRRNHARLAMDMHRTSANGVMVHVGNDVKEGDVYPLVITKAWGPDETSAFNGQLMLDGNDIFWVTSTQIGEGPGKCFWPPRV
jgi:hypothetical protein